jgi:prepilin-type N-terminal cleavage/methylation domain-containing protein
MQSFLKTAQRGFTLVELLIVVIILALLAAIVVPQFASSTDDAKLASLDTTLANIRASVDLYYQQHGEFPGSLTAVDASCTATDGSGTGGAGVQGAQAFLTSSVCIPTPTAEPAVSRMLFSNTVPT